MPPLPDVVPENARLVVESIADAKQRATYKGKVIKSKLKLKKYKRF